MKTRIRFMSFVMAAAILFSLSTSALAVDSETQVIENQDIVELSLANEKVIEDPEGGVSITFDLVQKVPPVGESGVAPSSIGWIEIVGWGQVKCALFTGNGMGTFDWDFYLENGDVITLVEGTFVLERNNAMLPDFNIAKEKVRQPFNTGTQFSQAHGQVAFDLDSDLDRDMNVRFKWSKFYITGVQGKYSIPVGQKAGTIKDFEV